MAVRIQKYNVPCIRFFYLYELSTLKGPSWSFIYRLTAVFLVFRQTDGFFFMIVDRYIIVQFIKKNPTKCNSALKCYYSIFIWSSTCFGRHTAHHQGPKTALAASGSSYVEGCWTCSWWTLSGTVTAHHQEPKTALAASGFSYVEGCWTCSWWTLSGTLCLTTTGSTNVMKCLVIKRLSASQEGHYCMKFICVIQSQGQISQVIILKGEASYSCVCVYLCRKKSALWSMASCV
jgi:hypothetical protein